MSLSDPKNTFAVMPNSHFFGLPKRDFARRIGLFEKPNGHVNRAYKENKVFFLKLVTCLFIAQ